MTGGRHIAVFMAFFAFPGPSAAQMPWPGDPPQSGAAAPWPGERAAPPVMGGPRPAPMGGGIGGGTPCMAEFIKLREDVEKKGMAAKVAGQKKVGREEMCKYVTTYAEAEATWVRFTESNVQTCGIPSQIVIQLKQVHANTEQTKQKICTAGPAGGAAPGPVMDDRLLVPGPGRSPARDDRPVGADTLPIVEDSVLPGLHKFSTPKDMR